MRLICLILVCFLISCGASTAPITDRLSGVWSNDLVRYEFDFAGFRVTQTALGQTETKALTIVSTTDQSIAFRTDGEPITLTLIDDTTATIAQAGKLPLQLKRQAAP